MTDSSTEGYPLEGALEALLFVSDEPVSAASFAKILDRKPSEVDSALYMLATRLEEEGRGIQLREVAGGWRFYTHPAYHDIIEQYVLSWDTRSLSQAALEALAVIAYHQPTTRSAISGIRGVNSDAVLSSLAEKGLVKEVGRDSGPGNAILYGTTRAFLEKFGLRSLKDLPPLEDFAPDEKSREYIRSRLSAGESALDGDRDDEAPGRKPGASPVGDEARVADGVDEDYEADEADGADVVDEADEAEEDLELVD